MQPAIPVEIQKLAEHQSMLCKVFSSPQRVLILWFLTDRERTVSEIAEAIGASMPSTSQHLHFMELNHILESHRERHNIFFRIADTELLKNCLVLVNRPKGQLMVSATKTS